MDSEQIAMDGEQAYEDVPVLTESDQVEVWKVNSVNGQTGDVVLTASDVGAPTTTQLNTEVTDRKNADAGLSNRISSNATSISNERSARQNADNTLQSNIDVLNSSLAPVAKSGKYSDLAGKPNLAPVATSGAYSDLTGKPTVDTTTSTTSSNAVANKAITSALNIEKTARANADTGIQNAVDSINTAINKAVVTDIILDPTQSTTTIQLDATKTNIRTSSTVTTNISMPVASSTQAGVMNSATYDAVTKNTSDINALTNGAVAITGLSASPTQSELTVAWKQETGLTSLMNRAGIYDVTNSKVWTYYSNDTTWHAASNSTVVTVNTFTNSSEGLIKGSTTAGQVFAENDGTGSVNGWDSLTSTVGDHTSKLATIEQGAQVNVQPDWDEADTDADDYIKNKPTIPSAPVQSDWDEANSNSLAYINNKPTIPTVNNATLTIQKNSTTIDTFTANSSIDKTIDISVPTAVSQLTNDSGFQTASDVFGSTESYTIATTDWATLSSSSPYTYSTTVTATHTIGNDTIIHLLNDQPIAFANYGFAVGAVSDQSVTIYSIGAPDASITLKINYTEGV